MTFAMLERAWPQLEKRSPKKACQTKFISTKSDTHLHGRNLIVERESLNDTRYGLENFCPLEVRYALKVRMQFSKRSYMWRECYAIIIT